MTRGSSADLNFYQYPSLRPPSAEELATFEREIHEALQTPSTDPVAVFLSVPFCRVHCNSCPFFRGFLPRHRDELEVLGEYASLLVAELEQYGASPRFTTSPCETVYMGGGTASLLAPQHVRLMIDAITAAFPTQAPREVTLEGNPHEFANREYLDAVREAGVTRVSLGYQSRRGEVLSKVLNSPHTADEGTRALLNTIDAGFESFNVDLLYATPGQTFDEWKDELGFVIELGAPAITIYRYVVFPDTASDRLLTKGRLTPPVSHTEALAFYEWSKQQLEDAGYTEQWKGGFLAPGHTLRYNMRFGEDAELIGLGAGAYSFVGGYQYRGPQDADSYAAAMRDGRFPVATEIARRSTGRAFADRVRVFNVFANRASRRAYEAEAAAASS